MVKEELEAAIAARTEMGAEMEPAVIDAFVGGSSDGSSSGLVGTSSR